MSTYYDVATEGEQRAVAKLLEELYHLQQERIADKIAAEKQLLGRLANGAADAAPMLQALDIQKELDRAQAILSDIVSVYMGIEAARRAAPTPEGHPSNTQGSISTGAQTQIKLSLEGARSRNSNSTATA